MLFVSFNIFWRINSPLPHQLRWICRIWRILTHYFTHIQIQRIRRIVGFDGYWRYIPTLPLQTPTNSLDLTDFSIFPPPPQQKVRRICQIKRILTNHDCSSPSKSNEIDRFDGFWLITFYPNSDEFVRFDGIWWFIPPSPLTISDKFVEYNVFWQITSPPPPPPTHTRTQLWRVLPVWRILKDCSTPPIGVKKV